LTSPACAHTIVGPPPPTVFRNSPAIIRPCESAGTTETVPAPSPSKRKLRSIV
jgi:hypothetical protein